jgi:hypothetical protein
VGLWFGGATPARSVKITGGSITVYEYVNYGATGGSSKVLSGNIPDLSTVLPWWFDNNALRQVSSVQFGAVGSSGGSGGGGSLWTSEDAQNYYLQTSHAVHKTISHTPGLYGVSLALDEAEQFPGVVAIDTPVDSSITNPLGNIGKVPGDFIKSAYYTIAGNTMAFGIRSFFFLVGVFLILGLCWNLLRANVDAGDIAKLAMVAA